MKSQQVKTCSKVSGKPKEAKEKPNSFVLSERLQTNCHAIKIKSKEQHHVPTWEQKQEKQRRGLIPVLLLSTLNMPWFH